MAAQPGVGDLSYAKRRSTFWSRAPVRFAVLAICILWFIPTLGLLVTSVRDPADITSRGWWTALFSFWDLSQWTLENYAQVLTADGMSGAFINSLIVAIPATVIPITVAAFAAYAFAWMRFPLRIPLFIIVVGLSALISLAVSKMAETVALLRASGFRGSS